MRHFSLVVSAVFAACGVGMVLSGISSGWFVAGFFGLGLLFAILEPRIPRRRVSSEYRMVITKDEIACEHPKRKRESIRWDDVSRIWYRTTAEGPRLPDEWILLEGEHGGCSFPTETSGLDRFWGEVNQRFPGFDYQPLIRGGTSDARHLCWERQPVAVRDP